MWLTSNHMFGSAIFGVNDPRNFWKFWYCPCFYPGHFQISQKGLGQFIKNCPPKHVITTTKRLKKRSIIDDIFLTFTKSIHYTWPSPNWFKSSRCFFRYIRRHNKLFKNIFNTFFLVDTKLNDSLFFRLTFSNIHVSFGKFSIFSR